MLSKKDKIFRKIRIVLDIINVLLSLVVMGLVVYTFLDVRNRMNLFPVVFYAGASVNVITGAKHMVSDHVWMGIGNWVIAVVLVFVGLFSNVIVKG